MPARLVRVPHLVRRRDRSVTGFMAFWPRVISRHATARTPHLPKPLRYVAPRCIGPLAKSRLLEGYTRNGYTINRKPVKQCRTRYSTSLSVFRRLQFVYCRLPGPDLTRFARPPLAAALLLMPYVNCGMVLVLMNDARRGFRLEHRAGGAIILQSS